MSIIKLNKNYSKCFLNGHCVAQFFNDGTHRRGNQNNAPSPSTKCPSFILGTCKC